MRRSGATLALVLCGLSLTATVTACRRRPPPAPEASLPFVFRSLNLRAQDPQGRPSWQLSSPEARYDLGRRIAQALRPQGVIFSKGQPLYRLSAESGTVINDGEVILLEGAIRVEQLGAQPVLIRASRVRWLPRRHLMEIDRHPEAFDGQNRLVARSARFLLERNLLELDGSPRLERWNRRVDPFAPIQRGPAEVVVLASRVNWEPRSGSLVAKGPLRATRRPEGAAPTRPLQTLIAASLEGNTIQQDYTLQGAIRFRDPIESLGFDGSEVRLQGRQGRIGSERPFVARRGSASARGEGFQLLEADSSVEILSTCALDRPGESLRAGRCRWNWKTQEIEARDGVIGQRTAQRQSIRGEVLQGQLGSSGRVEVSSPGGRVVSRFQVPRRPARARAPEPRRGPEPVRL